MNVKAIWLLPLAIVALSLTSTAEAEHPASDPATPSGPTDLCAQLDQYGDPLRCDAVGPGMATLWDDNVCCDARRCYAPTSSGGCPSGTLRYWCEYAQVYTTGMVDCLYEVPNYCDEFPCGPVDLTAPPLKHAICCYQEVCYDHEGGLCGGYEVWCGSGVTNEDGTVTCLDGDE